MTDIPVHYERDYGMSNGGRINRQVTHRWFVQIEDDVCTRRRNEKIINGFLWGELKIGPVLIRRRPSRDYCHDFLGIDRMKTMRVK